MLPIVFQRVAGGVIATNVLAWNGLMKVGGKVFDRVMPDGMSARYQWNAYDST